MPIVFEQPQPLSPSTSMKFGAASQYSRDLPSIAAMSEAAGRQRNALALGQLASFDRAMDRTFAAHDFDKRLQFEADDSVLRAQTALDIQAMRGRQEMAAQEQRVQLQNWLGQQDITQKEVLRQQHLQNGLAEVDAAEAAGVLTMEEANQARLSIRTPLEALKQKGMATEQRHLEAETARLREQTKRASVIAQEEQEFAAKTAQGRTATIINPAIRKEVEMEIVAAGLGNDPNFEKLVEAAAAKRPGGVEHWFQTAPGKWEKAFESGTGGPVDKAFEAETKHYETDLKMHQQKEDHFAKQYERALKRVDDLHYQRRKSTGPDKETSEPSYDQVHEEAMNDLKKMGIQPPGSAPLPPQRGGQVRQGGQQQTQQQPQSREVAPPSQAPAPSGPVADRIKETTRDIMGEQMMMLGQRQDIPEPIKQQAAFVLQEAAKMIEVAGGVDKMNAAERAKYESLKRAYRSLGINDQPAAAAPAPAPAAPNQSDRYRFVKPPYRRQ